MNYVLWSHWKDFLAGNTNLLVPHPDLATLHNTSFLCMFQQPGQVDNSWEVQGYTGARLFCGREGRVLCPPWAPGTISWVPAVSKMWQHWSGLKMCAVLCVLRLTQSPLLCLAWGKCVSHKINAHTCHSNPFCIPVASFSNQKFTSLAIGEYSFLSCCRWEK